MLWAGWEYIMFHSRLLQGSSKALNRRPLFTGPCQTARHMGTQVCWGHGNSLFPGAEDTILGGQREDTKVAHSGEELGTGLVVGTRLFSKC